MMKNCKLQIADCKLQIEQQGMRPAQHIRAQSWPGWEFAICNLQYAICNIIAAAAIALLAPLVRAADDPAPASPPSVIDQAQAKVVKIYGAGGFRGMEHYQSGFLISPDGHILTVWSYVLDTDYITVTLNDGRKFDAKLLGADPRMETAVLKIKATSLPYYDLDKAVVVDAGTRVLSLSNLFGVAMGNEPASVQHGTVSVVTQLEARHGVFETPYHGPVYVLDMTTNNPGAAGGAVVTRRGELAALLGKELKNSLNNTWLNYAVPIRELRGSIADILAGKLVARPEKEKTPDRQRARPERLRAYGIVLVPDVMEWTPAYVDQVRPGSSAAKAGIRPDDLVVLVGNRLVQSCKALNSEMQAAPRDEKVKLTVYRGGQDLVELTLDPATEEK
jgi:serine protease Do